MRTLRKNAGSLSLYQCQKVIATNPRKVSNSWVSNLTIIHGNGDNFTEISLFFDHEPDKWVDDIVYNLYNLKNEVEE